MTSFDVQPSSKYRTIVELGRGGMAEVHLALAYGVAGFKKLIALKRTHEILSESPEFIDMFLDEARLAARLNHPNVIQTYEVGSDDGRYFIAMEFLDGQPLHRIRAKAWPQGFPLAMQVRILSEALAGIHHAHELTDFDGAPLGVIHRDVTPQNVFVTYAGQVKVVDFGIAKAQSSTLKTRPGTLKGKITYMAPEQARREMPDRRVDIFAVGVMLWEAIVGERMWAGHFDSEILRRLEEGSIPSLEKKNPRGGDEELWRICRRALEPDRNARYATAAAFQHDLEDWLATQGIESTTRFVGSFVATHFADERADAKAMLERELGGLCPASAVLPRSISPLPPPSAADFESTVIESKAPSRLVNSPEMMLPSTARSAGADEVTTPSSRREITTPSSRREITTPSSRREVAAPSARAEAMDEATAPSSRIEVTPPSSHAEAALGASGAEVTAPSSGVAPPSSDLEVFERSRVAEGRASAEPAPPSHAAEITARSSVLEIAARNGSVEPPAPSSGSVEITTRSSVLEIAARNGSTEPPARSSVVEVVPRSGRGEIASPPADMEAAPRSQREEIASPPSDTEAAPRSQGRAVTSSSPDSEAAPRSRRAELPPSSVRDVMARAPRDPEISTSSPDRETDEDADTIQRSSLTVEDRAYLSGAGRASRSPGHASKILLVAGAAVALIAGTAALRAAGIHSGNSASAAQAAPPSEIDLTIRVSPPSALIFIDGVLVSTGTYRGRVVKDDRVHQIRAVAPHYVAMEQGFTTESRAIVALALERETPPTP